MLKCGWDVLDASRSYQQIIKHLVQLSSLYYDKTSQKEILCVLEEATVSDTSRPGDTGSMAGLTFAWVKERKI